MKRSCAEAVVYDPDQPLKDNIIRHRRLGAVQLKVDVNGNIYVTEQENRRLNRLLRSREDEVVILVGDDVDLLFAELAQASL